MSNIEDIKQIHGGCHCGQFRYSAEVDKTLVRICHCHDCQVLSGSAFRVSVPVEESLFTVEKGVLKSYVKVAASGNKRLQCFCENCGSQIYATSVAADKKRILNLRVGTIEQRQDLIPQTQQWSQSRLTWVDNLAKIVCNKNHSQE